MMTEPVLLRNKNMYDFRYARYARSPQNERDSHVHSMLSVPCGDGALLLLPERNIIDISKTFGEEMANESRQ